VSSGLPEQGQKSLVDTVKATIGKDGNDITTLAGMGENVEDGVGIRVRLGLDPIALQIGRQLARRELLIQGKILQGYGFADQNLVGSPENVSIGLLKHGSPAGVGARLKDHH